MRVSVWTNICNDELGFDLLDDGREESGAAFDCIDRNAQIVLQFACHAECPLELLLDLGDAFGGGDDSDVVGVANATCVRKSI
eukprot:3618569-Amphidinium_carterae.1